MAAKEHHIRMFVEDQAIVYIHHKPSDANNDKPGKHVSGPTKDKVKWQGIATFSIEFKTESPFVNGDGAPGSPINSPSGGSPTPLFELKDIGAGNIQHFPYTATMRNLSDDPEIIIDNSGGGGHGKKKPGKKKKKK